MTDAHGWLEQPRVARGGGSRTWALETQHPTEMGEERGGSLAPHARARNSPNLWRHPSPAPVPLHQCPHVPARPLTPWVEELGPQEASSQQGDSPTPCTPSPLGKLFLARVWEQRVKEDNEGHEYSQVQ